MNNRNLLDTLMYIFERLSQEKELLSTEPVYTTPDEIQTGLIEAGYDKNEVDHLIKWLESFNSNEQSQTSRIDHCDGFRIFHGRELEKIEPRAINYLMKLEKNGQLKPHSREFILDQIIKLDVSHVTLEQVKWILSMTKLNQEGSKEMLEILIQDLVDSGEYKKDSVVLH